MGGTVMTERFEVSEGDKGLMIYDNEGPDDYYFVNDKEELQKLCDLINNDENIERLTQENEALKKTIKELASAVHDNAELQEKLKLYEDAFDEVDKIVMNSIGSFARHEWKQIKKVIEDD